MGPGSDGPLGAMAGMEPHHMNGSLGNKPRKRTNLLMKGTAKDFFKMEKCFHFLRLWRLGRNEQGKSHWDWSRIFVVLTSRGCRPKQQRLAELLFSELPKQSKWHQQSSRDSEGRRRAEWKLPPLLPERERECPSPALQCCARCCNNGCTNPGSAPCVPPQYSPTMTMSVWPPPSAPPLPTLPSFQGSDLNTGHGQTHQHRIRDKAPFRFLTIFFFFRECWS